MQHILIAIFPDMQLFQPHTDVVHSWQLVLYPCHISCSIICNKLLKIKGA